MFALILGSAAGLFLQPLRSVEAQCSQDWAPDGSVVTCTGTDIGGMAGGDNLVIDVEPGAVIVDPNGDAIRTGDNAVITNDGYVEAQGGGDGIKVETNVLIVNNGHVESQHHDAIDTVTNSLTVVNNGTIESGDKGIDGGPYLHVENNGTINTQCEAIFTNTQSTINNNAGGVLHSEHCDVIEATSHAEIVNNGTISTGTEHALNGVDMTGSSGNVVNNGSISAYQHGVSGGTWTEVENNGTIHSQTTDGVKVNMNSEVVNNGTITTGTTGLAGVNAQSSSTVINEGEIMGGCNGVRLRNDSTLINDGTISGDYSGLYCDTVRGDNNVTITNNGTITTGGNTAGDGDGIQIISGTVQNNGAIDTRNNGDTGIEITTGTVDNDGTIRAYCNGIRANGVATVDNDRYIYSEYCDGIRTGDGATVINDGYIETGVGLNGDGDGIDVGNNVTVINEGTINTNNKPGTAGDNGIEADNGARIINEGTITADCYGIRAGDNANIENYGSIYAENCDALRAMNNAQITNYGTVNASAATSDDGIAVINGTIYNDGTIIALDNGIEVNHGTDRTSLIVHSGSITAQDGIVAMGEGSQTVIIEGDINARNDAVNMGNGNDRVEVHVGSVIVGELDGSNGIDALVFHYTFEAESFYVPAEYQAIQNSILTAPTTGCPCVLSVSVGGQTYNYVYNKFEQLGSFLHWIQRTVQASDPGYDASIPCYNGIKCFALTNGTGGRTGVVQVYDASGAAGVQLASFDVFALGNAGGTFSHASGARVVVNFAGWEGSQRSYTMTVVAADGSVKVDNAMLLVGTDGSFSWR